MQLTACDTVKVCPATVIVPVRGVDPLLAATLYLTVPFPMSDPPLVIVIQALLLTAVHEHDFVVVTSIALPPPPP